MKRKSLFLIIFTVFLGLITLSCDEERWEEERKNMMIEDSKNAFANYVTKVDYDGHTYILFSYYMGYKNGSVAFTHDPDCSCNLK